MSLWLKPEYLARCRRAREAFESPIPEQVVSNGEWLPPPRSENQRRVAAEIHRLADIIAPRHGLNRRDFLRSSLGLAVGFAAMNKVYGAVFQLAQAETQDPLAALERRKALAGQFIFDVQLHFVADDYPGQGILGLRNAARKFNPELPDREPTMEDIHFDNFVREVYLDSDTTIGLLSGAPNDDPDYWFLSNDRIMEARREVNEAAGSRRLLAHAVFTPGQPGWVEEVERAIAELKPDSWKGYTLGDPGGGSQYPWRLDDEELMYPVYEKMVEGGIRTICIHKGLVPPDWEERMPELWPYASVQDLPKAAKDWPQLDFVMYHCALANTALRPGDHLAEFRKTGRIPWVSDLAEIPKKHGVTNVHAEIGTSFATAAITQPAWCSAMLGTLIQGMGADHVFWGTDSVWYGSPQWQIEAFRRMEIPEDLRKEFGFEALGPADGPVKQAILGDNAARMYGIEPRVGATAGDRLSQLKAEREAAGTLRSNRAYGFVRSG